MPKKQDNMLQCNIKKSLCANEIDVQAMPFHPGQSGNPGGKKKQKRFLTALEMELKAVEADDQRGLRKIARNLIVMAEAGDMQAIKEIRDTLDGKPAQAIIGGDEDDNPINILARIERIIVDQNPANSDSADIPAVAIAEQV
jgi:hypothetical protein